MEIGFYGDTWGLGVSRIDALMAAPETIAFPSAWLTLYGGFVSTTLGIAITGHLIIAGLRLLGFNVFRNTYKPLLCETLIDFWGRLHYYFKELLVEFFFYPTYLKYRKLRPHLRLTVAVFAAAFLGNMYYHVLAYRSLLLDARFADLWQTLNPRLVYCGLLAAGISLSMIRQRKRRGRAADTGGAGAKLRRLRAIFGVWTFYAVIQIWRSQYEASSALDRLDFLLALLGL